MATDTRSRGRLASRRNRSTSYSLASRWQKVSKKEKKDIHQRKKSRIALEKKDWEDATCSVCMEHPHNAVLLLCSSHEKGCRPYMCGTSYRYSNCLDQFKKAYTKVTSPPHLQHWHELANNSSIGLTSGMLSEKCEIMELACPLCRGQVKGMTVVEPAREYLNTKKRSCTQDDCSFTGTYKELRKHVKQEHPFTRPREVDPTREQKWRNLEHERELDDVLSTIWATTPRGRVVGDYVIEGDHYDFDTDDDEAYGEYYEGADGGMDDPTPFGFYVFYHPLNPEGNASFQSLLRRRRTWDDIEEGMRFPRSTNASGASLPDSFRGGTEILSPNSRLRGRVVGREGSERRRRRRSQRRPVLDVT